MERFNKITRDGQAAIAVDIAVDEVLNKNQVYDYFETCDSKNIDKYTIKGFKILLGFLTEEQMCQLENLLTSIC